MFEYTSKGAIQGRLNLMTCPVVDGQPADFNMINFAWAQSGDGSTYDLTSATASFNNAPLSRAPAGWFPQPPAGTDGLYFESDLDDFQSAYWLHGQNYLGKALSHPQHVRLETWTG